MRLPAVSFAGKLILFYSLVYRASARSATLASERDEQDTVLRADCILRLLHILQAQVVWRIRGHSLGGVLCSMSNWVVPACV
jgi:hypothetical protein